MPDTDWQLRTETCRIELWRGYVTSSFVARSTGDGGAVSGPSPSFRARGKRPPDSLEAKLAHDLLVERLKDEGWSVSDHGAAWYEVELVRPATAPWHEPEPVAAEPERHPLLPPPLPAPVMAAVAMPSAAEPERPLDRWRVTAAIALAAALLFLLLLALH